MDINSIITAYLIAQGAHTTGHFKKASENNVPIRLNPSGFSETWRTTDRRKYGDIAGAGFENQDVIENALPEGETKDNVALMNAALKGAYLLDLPKKLLNKRLAYGGDIGGMEEMSNNKLARYLLLASMLSDWQQSQKKDNKYSLDFTTIDGNPGLKLSFYGDFLGR